MARKSFKDATVDGEMIYCFAKTEKLADLEEFINAGQVAKISDCGDRCFDEGICACVNLLCCFFCSHNPIPTTTQPQNSDHTAKIEYNQSNSYQPPTTSSPLTLS